MFERYTESARRLIFVARYVATQAGSRFVETEHFALAILKQESALSHSMKLVLAYGAEAAETSKNRQIRPETPSVRPPERRPLPRRSNPPPGSGSIGSSTGHWTTDPARRLEAGAHVTETHSFYQGHEITTIERAQVHIPKPKPRGAGKP
jgi:hypothetical protein